ELALDASQRNAGDDVAQSETAPRWSGPPPKEAPDIDVDQPVVITEVDVEYPTPDARFLLPNQPLRLRIDYVANERIDDIAITFDIFDSHGDLVFGTDTETLGQPIVNVDGVGAVCFDFADIPLLEGRYRIDVALTTRTGGSVYDSRSDVGLFEIMQPGAQRGSVSMRSDVVHFFHNLADVDPSATN